MEDFTPWYEARDDLVATLEQDLIGPGSDDEVIEDLPLERYIAGVIYPRYARPSPAQDDSLDSEQPDSETDGDDAPVAMAHVKYPSSMGLTFSVDPSIESSIIVEIEAARYEATEPEQQGADASPAPPAEDLPAIETNGTSDRGPEQEPPSDWDPADAYRRRPMDIEPVKLHVSIPNRGERKQLAAGLSLFVRIRPADADGNVTVTLALVNDHELKTGLRDEWCFFQPRISVRAGSGTTFPFVDKWSSCVEAQDPDLRSFQLLYRDVHHYATGHGCSVTWKEPGDPAEGIWTTFVPRVELYLADAEPDVGSADLGMSFLATGSREAVLRSLGALADSYEIWIRERRDELANLDTDELRATAETHLEHCVTALNRIRSGAELLRDQAAWRAFQLANRAMLRQRSRADWIAGGSPADGPIEGESHAWRPFQIAFILQSLRGIADDRHPDRDLADLLWFPTGGGKTEAYLGLIAFTVFHRRLTHGARGAGVVAIMRYTLRLLTIQQFQRAAMLICSCESLRRESPEELGRSPITLGLWVGGKGSPNSLGEAAAALKKLRSGAQVSEGNPIQLHSCPWCGVRLSVRNYFLNRDKSHLVIACQNDACDFSNSLPVYVVDDEVYRDRPTLIVATVDKFASIAWREDTQKLFNKGTSDLSPDLIIQDELHLISGPLGTITGLYETAIDALCSREGVRPKVIASTATIRRAEAQAVGLFNREVRQFPPPGLLASDSFFSVEASRDARPTRCYVGVMAPGTSHTTLMIRTYASILQRAYELESCDQVRDAYWTLVGYFNSLRVLGGARIAVLDDVVHRAGLLASQRGSDPRDIAEMIELTSREASSDIPAHLDHMAVRYPDEDALDVILATNMISVGVDVDRLGLMAVMGQPQSSSEYIQATSRVGRQRPGLVVTILNAARSRDRSHFEGFVPFHRSVYRHVEATSVTPFAPRARDRALHAVYVGLVRLLVPAMRRNDGAARIEMHLDEVKAVEEIILQRVAAVEPREIEFVRDQLAEIRERWRTRATEVDLVYSNPRETHRALLVGADESAPESFPTLWSMRDVDQSSNLYLIG